MTAQEKLFKAWSDYSDAGIGAATYPCFAKFRTPQYRAWANMKTRCYNRNFKDTKYYLGRGIIVCARWLHSFDNFLADVGPRPGRGYSLDRFPNRDGNYEPGNVRWATTKEQRLNTSFKRIVVYQGAEWRFFELCRHLGVSEQRAYRRLIKGHRLEVIFDSAPMKKGRPKKND